MVFQPTEVYRCVISQCQRSRKVGTFLCSKSEMSLSAEVTMCQVHCFGRRRPFRIVREFFWVMELLWFLGLRVKIGDVTNHSHIFIWWFG